MNFTTSQKGIALIKSFEGCRLTAYRDTTGVLTIGYGHTCGVYEQMSITEKQAEIFLRSDLKVSETAVNRLISYAINQNQFDALVSFTFNLGTGSLEKSTLRKKINQGDIVGAANEFDKWNKADGKVLEGLVRRRAAEKALFLGKSTLEEDSAVVKNVSIRNSMICVFQNWLNLNYSANLMVDGIYGNKTREAAVKAYQTIIGVTVDGKFNTASMAAVKALTIGNKGNDVYILQGMLYCKGFNPSGFDGVFGSQTMSAVKNFQTNKGLTTNGRVEKDTMNALFNL